MVEISNLMFWISNGLLIPVIVILLVLFVQSLVIGGSFVGILISRLKFQKLWKEAIKVFKYNRSQSEVFSFLDEKQLFSQSMIELIACEQKLHGEKVIADYETNAEKELGKVKSISKLGPMLGLMGTLIPMGPALVGLAAGDIASMAQSMQVAFATTVVGLFAGAVAYVVQLSKQRWYIEDLNNLEFILEVKFQKINNSNNQKNEKKETVVAE